jgi:ABC-type multidrug transport system ATPase subunit
VTMLAVRVDGISKRFGNHVAVDDVSFEVPAGVI